MQENNRAELEFMINIGKEPAGELDSVGIGSAEELEQPALRSLRPVW